MASLFDQKLQSLKGVGAKRAQLFEKLGVDSVGALLRYYPRAYEDWSHPFEIDAAPFDCPVCIRAAVISKVTETRIRKGMTLYRCQASDGSSVMWLTFFNNRYIPNLIKQNGEYLFYGKVGGTFTKREMTSPSFTTSAESSGFHPVYGQTEGLSSRQIEAAVRQALSLLPERVNDPLPEELRASYQLEELGQAIRDIHLPQSEPALNAARRRLIFEELFVLQLGLCQLKTRNRRETSCFLTADRSQEFFSCLPFPPTGAQRRAVAECVADMRRKTPMNRLIQGDVGSGKTAVAAALCYCAAREGIQSAFMAPTEILAEQHYHTMEKLFEGTGVSVALLTGSTKQRERRELLFALKAGQIHLLIGTHALLSDPVEFQRLGLVITDEQHRFGVAQRAALAGKGENPHLLVMSATPIPRTLALMIYGDLDVSVLDELPPGRQKIDTFWIDSKKRGRAYGFLQKHLNQGLQGYIVCPLVENESGEASLASAVEYAESLKAREFRDYRVGLLHGRMKPAEKEAVMRAFSRGELDLLVSTTVIEVGVDVPNAVIMLIENAERFGLSQLHQLRGRVGRGKEKSYCILVSDAQNEEAVYRLKAMCRTNDGFQIADEDLKLRGPGDFFGARQHGLPELKIADMLGDMDILSQAQQAAKILLKKDPALSFPEHRGIKGEIRRLFSQAGETAFN